MHENILKLQSILANGWGKFRSRLDKMETVKRGYRHFTGIISVRLVASKNYYTNYGPVQPHSRSSPDLALNTLNLGKNSIKNETHAARQYGTDGALVVTPR